MPSREEMQAFLDSKVKAGKVANIAQAKTKAFHGEQAKELSIDPKWSAYVGEVRGMLEQKRASAEACRAKLADGGVLDQLAYANLRLDIERHRGFGDGLAWALNIVEWAIKDGAEAAKILDMNL